MAWTERDITASRAGRVVFSARRITDAEYGRMQGDHDEEVPIRELERRYRLLSVVGSILSLEEATYCDCGGAHPISWTRFVSYDVARGTVARPRPIAGTDVVPEAALLTALTSDHLIGAAMDSADVRTFASVRELAQTLNTKPIEPPRANARTRSAMSSPPSSRCTTSSTAAWPCASPSATPSRCAGG